MNDNVYEIIVSLKQVPDGAIVRKITGEKEYIVKRNLKIFTDAQTPVNKEIKCDNECVFLIPNDGNICMYSESKKMIWITDRHTLYEYLYREINGPPQ